MLRRTTYVVPGRLGGRRVQDELAEQGSLGHQVLSMAGLAGRLVGGFARPVSTSELLAALQVPPVERLTGLRELAGMPGFARAAARTLRAVWDADLDLRERAAAGGRWAELAALEQHVEDALEGGALLPHRLVSRARRRVGLAPTLLGPTTLDRVDDLPPLYRGLLTDLAQQVSVTWRGLQPRPPAWLPAQVAWLAAPALTPRTTQTSCANPEHEALEALRWVHELLSSGRRPEEVAIGTTEVGPYDESVRSLAKGAGLPVHAAHGTPVLATPVGQLLAALADALARGPSQPHVRRIAAAAREVNTGPLAVLPETWSDEVHQDAGLTSLAHWRGALGPLARREPLQAQILERLVADVSLGLPAASKVGERWLRGDALALWRRALNQGPANVLEQSLSRLRVEDGNDPATSVIWGPAGTLVGWPRPYTRLLGLTARAWPRRAPDEDALLPQRLRPGIVLRERGVGRQDADNFRALVAATGEELVASWPRRGSDGRKQTKSRLLATLDAERATSRPNAGAHHALSEPDRLAGRPDELEAERRFQRARSVHGSAYTAELTASDGVVRPGHPAIEAALARHHSATSLKSLLLHPYGFVARYALGWQRPEPRGEVMALDPAALGSLLHEVLEAAVGHLALGDEPALEEAVTRACQEVGAAWEAERPVPPAALWRATLETVADWARWGLTFEEGLDFGQESYAELRFGYTNGADRGGSGPWSTRTEVMLPGTDLRLRGVIDRLDLDRVGLRVRVVDYKSGRQLRDADGLAGGDELQRPIYTAAVRQLLGPEWRVEALLAYPRHRTTLPLTDPDAALSDLAEAAELAAANLREGNAVAGPGLVSPYEDTRLAFPAYGVARYLSQKSAGLEPLRRRLDELLGSAT